MSEEFLNGAEIIAIFQQVRGKRMPQRVAIDRLSQSCVSRGLFDGSLPHRFVQMMPPVLTGPIPHRALLVEGQNRPTKS
jgi:hypothetical protein